MLHGSSIYIVHLFLLAPLQRPKLKESKIAWCHGSFLTFSKVLTSIDYYWKQLASVGINRIFSIAVDLIWFNWWMLIDIDWENDHPTPTMDVKHKSSHGCNFCLQHPSDHQFITHNVLKKHTYRWMLIFFFMLMSGRMSKLLAIPIVAVPLAAAALLSFIFCSPSLRTCRKGM